MVIQPAKFCDLFVQLQSDNATNVELAYTTKDAEELREQQDRSSGISMQQLSSVIQKPLGGSDLSQPSSRQSKPRETIDMQKNVDLLNVPSGLSIRELSGEVQSRYEEPVQPPKSSISKEVSEKRELAYQPRGSDQIHKLSVQIESGPSYDLVCAFFLILWLPPRLFLLAAL
ncbi:hypothetical protein D915_009306 [Fasciola hepatica]|uniref:Uncharacterized protein n=1 Tax=Fasciola hepatica TaxID=6192 RepID=A0A4E0R9M6_FASHE|nr:hypothetical protein D915_009306 [Fasciola hepatica]